MGCLALNTSLLGNCTPVESLKREKDGDWITAKTVNSDLERGDAMQTETQRLSFSLLHLDVDVEMKGCIWRGGCIKEWLSHIVIITVIILKERIKVLLLILLCTKHSNSKSNSSTEEPSYFNVLVVLLVESELRTHSQLQSQHVQRSGVKWLSRLQNGWHYENSKDTETGAP